jgi:hypothetical protein
LVTVGILILVRGGALLAVWIILEEELFFEIRRHKWWQLYFGSPGRVYAILSTSPAYYFGQLHRSFIWKKAMHPMATFPISDRRFPRQNSSFFGMAPKLPMWQTTVVSYLVHVCLENIRARIG